MSSYWKFISNLRDWLTSPEVFRLWQEGEGDDGQSVVYEVGSTYRPRERGVCTETRVKGEVNLIKKGINTQDQVKCELLV